MSAAFLDLPFVWSELMSRLTGTDSEHDAEVVRSFSEAFDIPERHVMSRIRTHLHRSLMLQ